MGKAMEKYDLTTQRTVCGSSNLAVDLRASTDPLQTTNRFIFSTDQVATRDRIDVTRELTSQLFGGLNILPNKDPDFRAGIWASHAGEVLVSGGHVTAIRFSFGSATHSPFGQTSYPAEEEGIFWIYRQGGAAVHQGAIDGMQDVGSAWFMPTDMPGAGETEGTEVLAIRVPTRALRRVVGHNRHLTSVALAKGNPLIRLLIGYIESFRQLPADADPALQRSIGSHLTDLVGLALGATKDATEQAQQGVLRSARLDAVLRAIASHYTNPDFSVADVAAKLRLSVRYVQDILHETGIGFAERVLESRLQEAFELLNRAHITKRKVSDVAFCCGFNNLSYFHRAFRRRFGMTPAGAR